VTVILVCVCVCVRVYCNFNVSCSWFEILLYHWWIVLNRKSVKTLGINVVYVFALLT